MSGKTGVQKASNLVIRGQSPSGEGGQAGSGGEGGGGGGAGAAAATDPSQPLVEVPFSLSSDAYAVQFQAIGLRLLPDEWFVGWGDQIIKFTDQNGGYEIPLSLQLGKVLKFGRKQTPMKWFIEPIYTPDGLRSGPGGAIWSIKLNATILFPELKPNAPFLSGRAGRCGGNCY